MTDSPQPDDESDEESSPFGPFIDLPGLSNIDWSAIDFSQVVRLLESSGPPTDEARSRMLDVAPLYAGETVARIGDILPAAEIVGSLAFPGYHPT